MLKNQNNALISIFQNYATSSDVDDAKLSKLIKYFSFVRNRLIDELKEMLENQNNAVGMIFDNYTHLHLMEMTQK